MYRQYHLPFGSHTFVLTVRNVSLLALLGAVFGLAGCASSTDESTGVETTHQALQGDPLLDSCGFDVTAMQHSQWKRDGYQGLIELTNVSGDQATSFEVFADLGGATVTRSPLAPFEATDGGYLFTEPHCVASKGIRRNHSHPILFKSGDPFAGITPYVVSINGVPCDKVPPTVTLESSGSFYTGDGTLTLTATASDNVAVKKVEFLRDGVVISVDRAAPYTLELPISSGNNGRERYTAVAYDVSDNQTSSNPKSVLTAIGNKFVGTAPDGSADLAHLSGYFNQVTPANAGKWGSVEATRDQLEWANLDAAYDYAQSNGMPFKLHTLVWGSQQPSWLSGLTPEEQLAEIEQWIAAAAARYPNVAMVDVVNEPLHAPPAYREALGGTGITGWDWVIKAFELARQYFPNAELLVNDYNVEALDSWAADYLQVISVLQGRGLVDGIGLQAHFLERAELPVVAANLDRYAATGLPIYVSELDVNFANDARQAQRMRDLFTLFWDHPSVVGITHWGYRQGAMWRPDAYLLRSDGTARPALDFIQCYRAGNVDCPVPEYVPSARIGDSASITLEAVDYDSAQGVLAAGSVVAYTDDGDWLSLDRVTFNRNWDTLAVTYAKGNTDAASISVHLGSLDSVPVATIPLPSTGGWGTNSTVSIPWAPIDGEHNVFIQFHGGYGVANLGTLKFGAPIGLAANVLADGDFESGSDGWWTWSSGVIATTQERALSGAQSLAMTGRSGNSPLVKSLGSVVVPGKTYKVSLWATIAGADSAAAHVVKKIQCQGGSASYTWLGGERSIAAGNWAEFSGDLVIPDCPLADVAVYLEGPGAGVDLYLDHVSARAVSSANLVSNGTFESGTSGWFSWNGGTLTASTARAHSGARSLLVTNRANNAPAATDLTSVVKPGGSYPMSVWVSIDSADGSSAAINVTRKAVCADQGTSYSWVGNQVTVSDDGQWVEIKGTMNVPNCNLTQLQLYAEGGAGVDLYVDDLRVIDPSLSNVLADGTFESGAGGWFTWGGGTLAATSSRAHGGAQSLGLTGRTGNSPIARNLMGIVEPGKSYQVVAWTSIDSPDDASANVNLTSKVQCSGDSATYSWLASPVAVADGGWVKLAGMLNVPACSLADLVVYAEGPGAGIDLYVDDVSVSPTQ